MNRTLTHRHLMCVLVATVLAPGAIATVVRVDFAAPCPAHDGAAWPTAFLTISQGLAVAQPGDEVWVAKGTYAEHLTVPGGVSLYGGFSGTETARDQRDWKANIAALQPVAGSASLVDCGFHSVVLDGFTIQAGTSTGVKVTAGSAVVAHCDITGTLTGDRGGVWATGGRVLVTGNRIRGFFAGVWGRTAMLTATGNDIRNCNRGVYAGASISSLAGNVLAGNLEGAYFSGGTAVLVNNTVAANTIGVTLDTFNLAVLESNLISRNQTGFFIYPASPSTAVMVSHGDVFGNTANYGNYTPLPGQGNLSVDPLFVDAANGDYRLQAGSPCIDAGDDEMAQPGSVDMDGRPRVVGPHVDIGAYEYVSTVVPFLADDVARCLSIAHGLSECTPQDLARLNVEAGDPALDLADASRIARKVAGLEANP